MFLEQNKHIAWSVSSMYTSLYFIHIQATLVYKTLLSDNSNKSFKKLSNIFLFWVLLPLIIIYIKQICKIWLSWCRNLKFWMKGIGGKIPFNWSETLGFIIFWCLFWQNTLAWKYIKMKASVPAATPFFDNFTYHWMHIRFFHAKYIIFYLYNLLNKMSRKNIISLFISIGVQLACQ